MDKVFYTNDGKLYKAKERISVSDAEMNFPTGDMLKALTEVPMTREEMIFKINHIDFNRKEAVLAKIQQ